MYSRLRLFKDLTALAANAKSHKPSSVANHLGLTDAIYQSLTDSTHYYDLLLTTCEKLFDNEVDQHTFEEQLRFMYGTQVRRNREILGWIKLTARQHAYKMFTVDKVIGSIIKQVKRHS